MVALFVSSRFEDLNFAICELCYKAMSRFRIRCVTVGSCIDFSVLCNQEISSQIPY